MRKLLLIVFLLLLGFVLVNRQRVFVRDPLATVYSNDAKQPGFQVYINYSNDVLLERDAPGAGFGEIVQHWNLMPGTPSTLRCIHWMACMTDSDHATTLPLDGAAPGYEPHTQMTSREASFVQPDGTAMRVTLR